MHRLALCLFLVACRDEPHEPKARPPVAVTVAPAAPAAPVDKAAALTTAKDNAAIIDEINGGAAKHGTRFDSSEIATLKTAFAAYEKTPGPETYATYADVIHKNYVLDAVMAQHLDFYLSYADEIVHELETVPDLARQGVRTQYDYLAEDLADIGAGRPNGVPSPPATTKGAAVANALKAADAKVKR